MTKATKTSLTIDDVTKQKLNAIVECLTFKVTGKPNGCLGDCKLEADGTLWFGIRSAGYDPELYNDEALSSNGFNGSIAQELKILGIPTRKSTDTSTAWGTYDVARFFLDTNAADFKERFDAACERIKPELVQVKNLLFKKHGGMVQMQKSIGGIVQYVIPKDPATGRALDETQAREVLSAAYEVLNEQAQKLGVRMQAGRIRGEG